MPTPDVPDAVLKTAEASATAYVTHIASGGLDPSAVSTERAFIDGFLTAIESLTFIDGFLTAIESRSGNQS